MIKARAITGMGKDRQALKAMLTPFVYRKYTDFSVFDSLRDMKAMIEAEVTRKGMLQNVKLGPGGIREVEFIAQAHQLIYGGKIPSLQNPCLKVSFMEMVNLELFPEDVAQSLLDAYEYLRNVEHGIQGMVDKQSQQLPVEDLERWRLSIIMGASNWDEFIQQLDNVRAVVKSHFEAFIQPVQASELKNPRHDNADAIEQVSFWKKFWNQLCLHYEEAEFYEELTTEQQDLFPILDKLLRQSILKKVSAEGRKRFDRFMPQLLLLVHEMPDPIYSLQSVVSVVMAVIRRTAYLVLLYENPIAFRHFIHLCSESEWIADTLSKTPSLLDEFLNTRTLYAPPNPKALSSELQLQLLAVPEEEEERQLEVLKFFKNSHVLRVAASEIQGTLPTMKVSDYLSWIAETVLKYAMDLAWAQISQKYGVPVYANGELDEQPYSRFAVVAYGKLGGLELSYSSDLDMVFIVDDDIQGATNGQRSIENSVFYSRLGQRILHILSSKTASGILYETDMRLRPSGNSGLLVTTLSAYRKYQEVSAWTWEKQAMVRARWVAGSTKLFQAFNGILKDMLCTSRKDDALREEIIAMRIKMYEAFKSKKQKDASIFDLKQEYGGLVDIEFLVQYAVLKNAFLEPSLAEWSDNMRILDTISDSGIWDEAQCRQLQSAYLLLRAKGHACVLQNKPLQISVSEVAEKVRQVDVIWKRQMADFSRG
jgi:glutamate-ammonia-ligase adenylyltransferase